LLHVSHEGKRLLLFKFRAGIAPLRIETGRYESNVDILTGRSKKGVPVECRICPCCYSGIEDEMHFLLDCPRYDELRDELVKAYTLYCSHSNRPFPENRAVLFNLLMACQDKCIVNALASYLWEAFNKRTSILGF
jgi:hypothetical protein